MRQSNIQENIFVFFFIGNTIQMYIIVWVSKYFFDCCKQQQNGRERKNSKKKLETECKRIKIRYFVDGLSSMHQWLNLSVMAKYEDERGEQKKKEWNPIIQAQDIKSICVLCFGSFEYFAIVVIFMYISNTECGAVYIVFSRQRINMEKPITRESIDQSINVISNLKNFVSFFLSL